MCCFLRFLFCLPVVAYWFLIVIKILIIIGVFFHGFVRFVVLFFARILRFVPSFGLVLVLGNLVFVAVFRLFLVVRLLGFERVLLGRIGIAV